MEEAPMQKQWGIYSGRLQRFLSHDYMAEMNIIGHLIKRRWSHEIKLRVYSPPLDKHVTFDEASKADYCSTHVGAEFGPSWSTHWFEITVPVIQDQGDWYFHWKSEAEGLVWTRDGRAVHGLSPQERSDFPFSLVQYKDKGEPTIFYIELACNGLFGNGDKGMIDPPNEHRKFKLERCEMREFNEEARKLFLDLQIIQDMAATLGEGNPVAKRALFIANKVINTFGNPQFGSLGDSINECQKIVDQLLKNENSSSPLQLFAIGNCHIDTAWLWRYKETRRKTARSWSSQLALMEAHPSFRFAASQMQQLEWIRQDYPELFERIKEACKKGQFIPIGGSWVEMDGNLPSGESFVRQFLYGQKFMLEHFGHISDIFWLPDTFGYNAQLPQLMHKAGIKYFVTQKLSWNNINRFPHTSFWWEGIDGSRVLTHFPPSNTYTSLATSGDVIRSEKDHKDVDRSNTAMLLYGHGDGGGGPTEAMISRLKRMKHVLGLPNVRLSTPSDFFHHLEKESADLLRWRGELYFELHRGTYTSQAMTKHYNRKCETLLKEAEMLSVINGIVSDQLNVLYPAEDLETLWKGVLLNQFHDVLPGSSIGSVYQDATHIYEKVQYKASKIRDDAMNWLFGNRVGGPINVYEGHDKGIVFFNTTPFEREEVLTVPFDGEEKSPQRGVIAVAGIKGFSMASFSQTQVPMQQQQHLDQERVKISTSLGHYIMENKFVKVHVDEKGHITSFFDKEEGREIIEKGGKANRFMMYEDVPYYWDAWDVELHHLEKGWCVSDSDEVKLCIGMEGPLLASLLRIIPISTASQITQVISLSCLSKRLDFTTRVEWHESHKMLKVDFPVAVRSEQATFECPFGMVKRPTHMNTSWDVARFEVCGHRFADLSESDYGVALLNDSKYGYSIKGSLMQLSLLRSPKMPDDECDMGSHVMRFALFPHQGCVAKGHVIEEAIKFNTPLLWTAASPSLYDDRWLNSSVFRFEQCHNPDKSDSYAPLIIDAIKLSEDGKADVIIRAYEPRGCRGSAILKVHPLLELKEAHACDLLEREEHEDKVCEMTSLGIKIEYLPFEIITLKGKARLSREAKPLPKHNVRETATDGNDSFENISTLAI